MLGANFINARNSEVDRQRRLRSENAQAFNAFVEQAKSSGSRVDPAEFEAFRRSLATNPYMNAALPSVASVRRTAGQINAEVARREAAAANAARAAAISRANAETEAIINQARLFTENGASVFGEDGTSLNPAFSSALANIGINDASVVMPILPGIVNNAINERAISVVERLRENGIETPEAAAPFMAQLPTAIRTATQGVYTARGEQANRAAATAAASTLTTQFPDIIAASGGDATAALAMFDARAATTELGRDAATEQSLRRAFEAQLRGESAGALVTAVTAARSGTSYTDDALVLLSQQPEGLALTARTILAENGVLTPTEEQIARVQTELEMRVMTQQEALGRTTVQGARTSVGTVLAAPDSPDNAALQEVNSIRAAETFIESRMGISLASISPRQRQELVGVVMNGARLARQDETSSDERQWSAILSGFAVDGVVSEGAVGTFQDRMMVALNGGEAEVLAVMNDARSQLGLDPYSGTGDAGFRDALARLEPQMRSAVANTVSETRAQILSTAQATVESRTGSQSAALAGVLRGSDQEGALFRVISAGIEPTYYLGATPAEVVSAVAYEWLEAHPDEAAEIESGNPLALQAATAEIATIAGIVRREGALSYELRAASEAHGGPEWASIPYGTSVTAFVGAETSATTSGIQQAVARIRALPADAPPEEVEAIRQGLADEARRVMDVIEQNVREGGFRYVLDYTQAQPAQLNTIFTSAHSQLETAIRELEEVAPAGQALGFYDNGDGTVTVGSNNPRGIPPGVYEAELGPTGRPQPNTQRPITVDPSAAAPAQSGASPFANDIAPTLEAIGSAINPPEAQVRTALNQVRSAVASGRYGAGGSFAGRATNYLFGSEESYAESLRNAEVIDYLNGDEAASFLLQFPETEPLLRQNPAAWVRLASRGTSVSSRAGAVAGGPR